MQEQPGTGTLDASTSSKKTPAFWAGAILGVLLTIASTLLIVQNSDSTDLTWLSFDFTAPLWLLLLASAVSGAIIASLVPPLWRLRRRRSESHS